MKFIVDAQLPARLARELDKLGHDAIHTLDLEAGNRTDDTSISKIADEQQRVVVTKDADFVNSHLISKRPARLLLVSTGNTSNRRLIEILQTHHTALIAAFDGADFVEFRPDALVIHG